MGFMENVGTKLIPRLVASREFRENTAKLGAAAMATVGPVLAEAAPVVLGVALPVAAVVGVVALVGACVSED